MTASRDTLAGLMPPIPPERIVAILRKAGFFLKIKDAGR
jgi:hypothetical protein